MSSKTITADDQLPANEVGQWAEEKHHRVANYVGITSSVRRKYIGQNDAGAAYLEPYCAFGRANIRGSDKFIEGSSIRAWREAASKKTPFTQFLIGDLDADAVTACKTRLNHLGACPEAFIGSAESSVPQMISRINPHGLHFAFLDPYNLASLPFTIIEALSKVKRMDMLIHVSSQDLQRNFEQYLATGNSVLDSFAPGWRSAVDGKSSMAAQRTQVFQYWLKLIKDLGKTPAQGIEHITASRNQTLYWLVLISSHPKAHELWEKIRAVGGQADLFA